MPGHDWSPLPSLRLVSFYISKFILCPSVHVHIHSMWRYAQSWFASHQNTRRIKKEEESHMFMFDVLQSISLLFEMPTTTVSPVSYFNSHVQPCFFYLKIRVKYYTKQPTSLFRRGSCLPENTCLSFCAQTWHACVHIYQMNQTLGSSVPLVWKCDKHSIILPVNVKGHVTWVVKADRKKKKSHMLHFLPGCCGTLQTHHRFSAVMSR